MCEMLAWFSKQSRLPGRVLWNPVGVAKILLGNNDRLGNVIRKKSGTAQKAILCTLKYLLGGEDSWLCSNELFYLDIQMKYLCFLHEG